MIHKIKHFALLIARFLFSVLPLFALWYFWLAVVRWGGPRDIQQFAIPTALAAMVLGVAIRIFIFRSVISTMTCLILTEIIFIVLVMLVQIEWLLTLSLIEIVEEMKKEMIFDLHTWNLVLGFVLGTFLASIIASFCQRKKEPENKL